MTDKPAELLALWQLGLLLAYILLAFPVLALVSVMVVQGRPPPPRVPCRTCGYAMVVLERECPRCRAAVSGN